MRVTKAIKRRACAVCERTLLQGEYAVRFSPDGVEFVDVCPLCQDVALEYGWVREGGRSLPRSRPRHAASDPAGRSSWAWPTARPSPCSRTRPPPARSGGRARGGGRPLQRVALPPHDRRRRQGARRAARLDRPALGREQRAGAHVRLGDHAVPVPGLPEAPQPIRLADRGLEISEIEAAFTDWNAQLDDSGRVVLERRPLALPGCPSEQAVHICSGRADRRSTSTRRFGGTGCRPARASGVPVARSSTHASARFPVKAAAASTFVAARTLSGIGDARLQVSKSGREEPVRILAPAEAQVSSNASRRAHVASRREPVQAAPARRLRGRARAPRSLPGTPGTG